MCQTTIVSGITRVWTTGLFDRNSFRKCNTTRCGVASDWADRSIITVVRPDESDPRDLVCALVAPPVLGDRPVERSLPDAGIALSSKCF
jgi:hypothetical protein